jgi:hypothetical protein
MKSTAIGTTRKGNLLKCVQFRPRRHTPAMGQGLVSVAGTEEQQADPCKESRVAAPKLLRQVNTLTQRNQPFIASFLIQKYGQSAGSCISAGFLTKPEPYHPVSSIKIHHSNFCTDIQT